ncbi:hypothetical protein RQP46_001909 [Phenoliferia psychrophenolica]
MPFFVDSLGPRIAEINLVPSSHAHDRPTTISSEARIKLKGFRTVASYNLMRANPDHLLVPGSPPVWAPPGYSITLKPDPVFFKAPLSSIQNMLAAIKAFDSKFVLAAADLIVSEEDLRALHQAVASMRVHESHKECRMSLDLIGNTLIISNFWTTDDGFAGVSFGEDFERRATIPPDEWRGVAAGEHYRVATFNFLGLRILEQFKVDARAPPQPILSLPSGPRCLEALLNTLDLSSPPSPSHARTHRLLPQRARSGRSTHPAGTPQILPTHLPLSPDEHNILFEIHSVGRRRPTTADAFKRLFWSQTPSLFLPSHQRGQFSHVERVDLGDLRDELKNSQEELVTLAKMFKEMRKTAKAAKTSALVAVVRDGKLEVYERKEEAAPVGVRKYF